MLDKALVSIMTTIIILIIFVSMMGMMLSIIQKIEFNLDCKATLYEMDMTGGLTFASRQKLEDKLIESGCVNIIINAPQQVQYGEWMTLTVSCNVKSYQWTNTFQKEEGMLYFSYNRKIISRKIHNMAY